MSLADAATAAAAAGLKVFPLKVRSKEPRVAGGFKSASGDPGYIAGLWSQWPDANIGLALPPDVVVIDVDSEEGAERVRELGLPPAAAVVRTRRGWQAYYRVPAGRTLRQGTLEGIGDLKVSGAGYTLLPPSIHPEGETYSFVRGGVENILMAIEIQDEHVDALEGLRRTTPAGGAPPLPETIPVGERNTVLTSLAGSMRRRGASEGEILAALEVANQDRCGGALETQELQTIASSVGRYPPAGSSAGAAFGRRSFAEVTPRAVRWLVPGVIPLRTSTLLAGQGGLGKSSYLLAVTAQVTRGDLGDPAAVIIISYEDPAEEIVRPRLEAAGADLERVFEILVPAEESGAIVRPRDLDRLEIEIEATGARLIIVDPVLAAIDASVDAHRDQDVRIVLSQLAALAERHECACVIVMHLNKAASKDAYLRISSSSGFYNAARSVVLVVPDPEEPEQHRLVAQVKTNWARRSPVERHVLEEIVLPQLDDDGRRVVTSRMRFLEIADGIDRDTILGAERAERSGEKLDQAEGWLRDVLADDEWHESAGIKRLAAAVGIAERTLQRAFSDLEVEDESRGFPRSTWWRLPQSRHPLSTHPGATVEPASVEASEPVSRPVAPSLSGIKSGATTTLVGRSVNCSKHAKITTISRVSAGIAFFACGCHVTDGTA
jgi:hypothetical protein